MLYVLLFLATLAAFGLCMLCCTLLLKILAFDENAAHLSIQILLISGLFYFAAELYVIQNDLLDAGRTEAAKNYLKKLEIHSPALSFPHHTGNPAIDVLLEEKLESAQSNGIHTEISLVSPKHSVIDDFDLCVVFANALDNGINACSSVEGSKTLRIIGRCQGDFYMLEFKNTCDMSSLSPVGTGLSNIKTIVEKYHCVMTTEKNERTFRLSLLLNHTWKV